jgi:hypothetical protein
MNSDKAWFQRLTRASFDVLVPLLNTVVPDRGRAKSLILKIPNLVERHLMSSPTYALASYVAQDDVIRIPEQFPIIHKSLPQWFRFIANNMLLNTILGLPKPQPIPDAPQHTSEESLEVSEDESEDENIEQEANLEMLDNVPESIIDNAIEYEASMNDLHRQQIIDDALKYVCLLYFFLIVGQYSRISTRSRVIIHPFISSQHSAPPRFSICRRDDAAQYLGTDCTYVGKDSES